ncbi:charged multivesicular body protein 4c-like [Symphorus nematophorus]
MVFRAGKKVRKKRCPQEEIQKLAEGEESLMKKKDSLTKKIEQELLIVKKNSRKNRRVALQALRRKKCYEKHVRYIDCAVKALRSADEQTDILNKVNDLIKDITEEQDGTRDMSDALCTSVNLEVEFDEDELLAELERLERILDESLFDTNRTDDESCPKLSSTESSSQPAETEEDDAEEDLRHLWRWLHEPS